MSGMNRHTGRSVAGQSHVAQSIHDILPTRRGDLVSLRDYGSDLPALIDQPLNGETTVDAYMAIAEALDTWEPRVDLGRIELVATRAGYAEFDLLDVQGARIALPPIDLRGVAA
jgi:phage baseplate assembly protein W